MKKILLLLTVLLVSINYSCTTDQTENELTNIPLDKTSSVHLEDSQETDDAGEVAEEFIINGNRGGSRCRNVVIVGDYAYAACSGEIRIAELATGDITTFSAAANDITADAERQLIFTQSGTTIRMYDVSSPTAPVELDSATANFSIFSGLSAAGCVLAVSGGAGGSNTQVYLYSADNGTLQLTTNGIPVVDGTTGAPDVHVAVTGSSEITAFYSEDIGAVANWAIQPAIFNGGAVLQSTPTRTVLTSGAFGGPFGDPFGPANFPVESEFLDGLLYVAHFAVQGIEIVDVASGNLLTPIDLTYQPTNIGTDGVALFVVGVTNSTVDIIDPDTGTIAASVGSLNTPTGVDANATHIAVADQILGLIIIPR